jgi:hypothetical protein
VNGIDKTDSQQDFARALGDALRGFLEGRMLSQAEAAKVLELFGKNGEPRRSRLNTYFRDVPKGKRKGQRTEASAQVLYLACTKLGFQFDYGGYRIRAVKLGEKGRKAFDGQTAFNFERQFDLVKNDGNVEVKVKRPAGRIELRISLDAEAM